jgi:hypothetical protein
MVHGVRKLWNDLTAARSDERGMMLVEVVVSAVSLVGMGLATFALLDQAGETSGMNRARSVATSLAQNDQDQMRQMPYQRLLARSQDPRELTVDGRKYLVTSKVEMVDDSVGTSDCSATSKSAKYVKMTSSVSSPGSALEVPVVLETMRAPTIGGGTLGSVAVRLSNGEGDGVLGVPVIAGPVGGSTNNLGCAFLDDVPEGTVTVSWSKAGYVNENGLTNVVGTVAVRTDSTAVVTGNYDVAGSATVSLTNKRITDPGTITAGDRASWKSVTAVNQGITSVPVGERRFAQATTQDTHTLAALYPFSNDYGFYAGGCDGNNPEVYLDGSGVAKRVLAGANAAVAVDLPAIGVTVRSGSTMRSGYRVYATPNTTAISPNPASTMEECTEGLRRSGGSDGPLPPATASTGKTTVALPYGIWNVCIDNNNSGTPRRFIVRYNNTPLTTPSPLAPGLIAGQRAIDLDLNTVSLTSSLCP